MGEGKGYCTVVRATAASWRRAICLWTAVQGDAMRRVRLVEIVSRLARSRLGVRGRRDASRNVLSRGLDYEYGQSIPGRRGAAFQRCGSSLCFAVSKFSEWTRPVNREVLFKVTASTFEGFGFFSFCLSC